MESKVIKQILSTLLVASAFGSAPCFVSAEESKKCDLNAKISEYDAMITECNETMTHFQEQKSIEIKSINEKINNNLETIDLFKKFLSENKISQDDYEKTSKDLEEKNRELSKKIESIEEIYRENIRLSCETLEQLINQKTKIQKDLDKLTKEEGENLIEQIENFKKMCFNSKINQYVKHNTLILSIRVRTVFENNQLTEENIK